MKFRPCIDIHNGKVKQIVGGSLKDAGNQAQENFVSEQDAAFYASLYKEKGVVTLNKSFDFMCSQLRNGRYRLIIERYTEPRTLSQNALMWLWFTCIEQETGTDKQDVHDYYCNLYLRRTTIIKGKETVIAGSTSKLNTLQMTDFLNKVKADAATELGITLPLPEDRYYNEFVNEYKYRR